MNELTFTSKASVWINEILQEEKNLPFINSLIEEFSPGTLKRNDFVLHGKNGKALITGEAKLPDKTDGNSPFNDSVVIDAQAKANRLGVEYFFTWNVNRCVLWQTFQPGVPITERRIAVFNVLDDAPIRKSDDINQPRVEAKIKSFLKTFLRRCAAALSGEKPLLLLPPDETFLRLWEAALDLPVAQSLEFRNKSGKRGRVTPNDIAKEIWDNLESPPDVKTLLELTAGYEAETIQLPKAKAQAVDNLFEPESLFVAGIYIPLQSRERVLFAKALSEAGISGKVLIPTDASVCARALQMHEKQEADTRALFEAEAAARTIDQKTRESIVRALYRKMQHTA